MPITVTKADLLGDKVPITEIADVFDYTNPVPVRKMVLALGIPYVTVNRIMHVSPAEFREGLERRQVNRSPRGRGRPSGSRKSCAQHAE